MSDEFTGPEPGDTELPTAPPPPPRPEETGLSSVEIGTTAKGDPQVKVKVYAESNSPQAVQMAADNAADLYRTTLAKVRRQ